MKLYSIISILLVGLVQTACDLKIPDQAQPGDIQLFPDYESVTIPVNIAPLNFRFLADDTNNTVENFQQRVESRSRQGSFQHTCIRLERPATGCTRKRNSS